MTKEFTGSIVAKKLAGNNSSPLKIIFLSSGFSVILLVSRILFTGSLMYGFLAWNLFLAWVPYALTIVLQRNSRWRTHPARFGIVFLCWLFFIPNSFYIITDLFHLDQGNAAPPWFDLALLFSFVWNGLLFGILSLRFMERIIDLKWTSRWKWTFVYGVIWLNALGIYIGRYLRFNSWDVISNPFQLTGDILFLCLHPLRNSQEWCMITCFAILVTLIYKSVIHIGRTMLTLIKMAGAIFINLK